MLQHLLFILPAFVYMYAHIYIYIHIEDRCLHVYLYARVNAQIVSVWSTLPQNIYELFKWLNEDEKYML